MKVLTGKVVSTKQDKTVVVEVERHFKHPVYEKRMRRTKKYQVHVPDLPTRAAGGPAGRQAVNVGDQVRFVETRPISKTKRWRIVK